jgi:hypothetical protein
VIFFIALFTEGIFSIICFLLFFTIFLLR